jgi:hypothetical protein
MLQGITPPETIFVTIDKYFGELVDQVAYIFL